MFVVFFFFKQKTAYEMRISDWSSDVCSSDLIDGAEVGGGIARASEMHAMAPEAETLPRLDQCLVDAVELVAVRTVIMQPFPLHHARLIQPIGRASCRERVCQ